MIQNSVPEFLVYNCECLQVKIEQRMMDTFNQLPVPADLRLHKVGEKVTTMHFRKKT